MKPSSDQQTVHWPAPGGGPTKAAAGLRSWIQTNGFILGLFAVVGLAFLFPDPGSRKGWMHPELVQNVGIALILFLQGLSMPLEKVRKGAGNWKLHVIIQGFTFVIFPIVAGAMPHSMMSSGVTSCIIVAS